MNKKKSKGKPIIEISFEEIFKQNERRIHYHIDRLGIRDPTKIFIQRVSMPYGRPFKNTTPTKAPLGTYFNYTIRNRLVDMLRKETREMEKKDSVVETEKQRISDATTELKSVATDMPGSELEEREMWQDVKSVLTAKQWEWVYYYIIQGMPLKEIAEMKGVSVEAVKGWGEGSQAEVARVGCQEASESS